MFPAAIIWTRRAAVLAGRRFSRLRYQLMRTPLHGRPGYQPTPQKVRPGLSCEASPRRMAADGTLKSPRAVTRASVPINIGLPPRLPKQALINTYSTYRPDGSPARLGLAVAAGSQLGTIRRLQALGRRVRPAPAASYARRGIRRSADHGVTLMNGCLCRPDNARPLMPRSRTGALTR